MSCVIAGDGLQPMAKLGAGEDIEHRPHSRQIPILLRNHKVVPLADQRNEIEIEMAGSRASCNAAVRLPGGDGAGSREMAPGNHIVSRHLASGDSRAFETAIEQLAGARTLLAIDQTDTLASEVPDA